jgi:hypothetical protein
MRACIIGVLLSLLLLAPVHVRGQCCGDCNGDGEVTIDEIITAVNIALELLPCEVPVSTRTPTAPPTRTSPPVALPTPTLGGDSLSALLGTWRFETTMIDTFIDHYRLEQVVTLDGTPVIVGTDLDEGDMIVAARGVDLGTPVPGFTFGLLDPGLLLCDFFLFNQTAPDRVEGVDVLTDVDSTGDCVNPGNDYPMVGFRTGSALVIGPDAAAYRAQLKRAEAKTANGEGSASSAAPEVRAALRAIQERLQ